MENEFKMALQSRPNDEELNIALASEARKITTLIEEARKD